MEVHFILEHWQSIRDGLFQAMEKLSDEDLDYKPFERSWSVRQILLHIAQEEWGEFGFGIAQELHEFPAEYPQQDFPTLDSAKALLERVHEETLDYVKNLQDGDLERFIETPWGPKYSLRQMIWHIIEHETHHRGELSLILGRLGHEGIDA